MPRVGMPVHIDARAPRRLIAGGARCSPRCAGEQVLLAVAVPVEDERAVIGDGAAGTQCSGEAGVGAEPVLPRPAPSRYRMSERPSPLKSPNTRSEVSPAVGHGGKTVCRMLERISEPFSISRLAAAAGPAALNDKEWRDEVIQAVRAGREPPRDYTRESRLPCSAKPRELPAGRCRLRCIRSRA